MNMNGFKDYKSYSGVPLKKVGFNAYNTKGNTKLGKLIRATKQELPGCLVWYKVNSVETGNITIVYKEL